jgi:dTDP-4-dehydrorhamnose reductase
LLSDRGYEVYGYGRAELDITNFDQVQQVISEVKPDVVIHAAAYTEVDLSELEPDQALAINAYGTRNVVVVSEKDGSETSVCKYRLCLLSYHEFAPKKPAQRIWEKQISW